MLDLTQDGLGNRELQPLVSLFIMRKMRLPIPTRESDPGNPHKA